MIIDDNNNRIVTIDNPFECGFRWPAETYEFYEYELYHFLKHFQLQGLYAHLTMTTLIWLFEIYFLQLNYFASRKKTMVFGIPVYIEDNILNGEIIFKED